MSRRGEASVVTLLDGATAVGVGSEALPQDNNCTFQGKARTTSGAGSASIDIEVSNDGTVWQKAGTLTMTITAAGLDFSDGFVLNASWKKVRAKLTALTGTGAKAWAFMGV